MTLSRMRSLQGSQLHDVSWSAMEWNNWSRSLSRWKKRKTNHSRVFAKIHEKVTFKWPASALYLFMCFTRKKNWHHLHTQWRFNYFQENILILISNQSEIKLVTSQFPLVPSQSTAKKKRHRPMYTKQCGGWSVWQSEKSMLMLTSVQRK